MATYADCSGCSLCVLVCPVWRSARDLRFTPEGRCKALQHGATVPDIAPSVEACTLCSACEVVCPENIALVDQVLGLRQALFTDKGTIQPEKAANLNASSDRVLLADSALSTRPELLGRISVLLNCTVAPDDGTDIAQALETGQPLARERKASFIDSLTGIRTVISSDGLLTRHLRGWAPQSSVLSLGQALSALPPIRKSLSSADLYVIEPRAYHSDYAKLIHHYDGLRRETGCMLNLDLQRVAVPARTQGMNGKATPAQAEWLLKGRNPRRIVVEDLNDMEVLKQASGLPVLHVAELGQTQ